jgi:hypothetical protein
MYACSVCVCVFSRKSWWSIHFGSRNFTLDSPLTHLWWCDPFSFRVQFLIYKRETACPYLVQQWGEQTDTKYLAILGLIANDYNKEKCKPGTSHSSLMGFRGPIGCRWGKNHSLQQREVSPPVVYKQFRSLQGIRWPRVVPREGGRQSLAAELSRTCEAWCSMCPIYSLKLKS